MRDVLGSEALRIQFEHSYSALAPRIYARVGPTPVANPQLVVFNRCLAKELGLDPDVIEREAAAMLRRAMARRHDAADGTLRTG